MKGGDQSSPSRRSSPCSRSSASSPTQSGGAANEPPSQHPEYDHNTSDQQTPTTSFHPIEMEVDDVEVSPHRQSDAVMPNKLPFPSARAQVASDARVILDDDARVDVIDRKW